VDIHRSSYCQSYENTTLLWHSPFFASQAQLKRGRAFRFNLFANSTATPQPINKDKIRHRLQTTHQQKGFPLQSLMRPTVLPPFQHFGAAQKIFVCKANKGTFSFRGADCNLLAVCSTSNCKYAQTISHNYFLIIFVRLFLDFNVIVLMCNLIKIKRLWQ
jgi:hypothetical protein